MMRLLKTRLLRTNVSAPAEYRCPFCQAVIPPDDVNVATDVAHCRACGQTSSFALVSGAEEISLTALDQPPKGIRVSRNLRGGTKVVYQRASRILLFLVPFTAFWSGGSLSMAYGAQLRKGEFDAAQFLAGVPFLIGTVILLGFILFLVRGRWEVVAQQGEGSVFVGLGDVGWRRQFRYNRESTVCLRLTNLMLNEVRQRGVCVSTDGREFVFASVLKEPVKQFLAATVLRAIAELR